MNRIYVNPQIIERFSELIKDGKKIWNEVKETENCIIKDPVKFNKWATSSLNLLDKLSISTNRFVRQFENYAVGRPTECVNVGASLGVLESAKEEYEKGMAIEYHLSISATVFSGILDEASYLLNKNYLRSAMVLIGAALEEAFKAYAKAYEIEITNKETLSPLIDKLRKNGIISDLDKRKLESIVMLRNKAAHGGEFEYTKEEIEDAYKKVEEQLEKTHRR
ncbi:MAG: DUF4145 domain-containing protein [Bacteroidales bacterium]